MTAPAPAPAAAIAQDQLPGLDSPWAASVRDLGWAVRMTAPGQYQAAFILPADQMLDVTLTVVIDEGPLAAVLAAAELASRAMIAAGILPDPALERAGFVPGPDGQPVEVEPLMRPRLGDPIRAWSGHWIS